jgi:hypothetical protein
MIAASRLQREVDKKYALRFVVVLALGAICCAGFVGSLIWIVGRIYAVPWSLGLIILAKNVAEERVCLWVWLDARTPCRAALKREQLVV